MTIQERLQNMSQSWFLTEPALFEVYCSHHLEENAKMSCAIRTGKGRIEYNTVKIREFNDCDLELLFRSELIRILLKHPYGRQPENCKREAVTMASDCVLTDNYFNFHTVGLTTPGEAGLPGGQPFEWYAHRLSQQEQTSKGEGDETGDGQGDNCSSKAQQSELWEEDQMKQEAINAIIQSATSWGSIQGKLLERIKASTKPQIDYRRAFAGFRSSVISSRRHLTRMRPNRRMDFEQMGSVYSLTSRLLVAVDVSASINTSSLVNFYSLINRFFKYGIEQIDAVQFDVKLGEIQEMKKATTNIAICGRGGTLFQPVVDYASTHKYDGLVIMTDGYAPVPQLPLGCHLPMLWVTDNERNYNTHHNWMEQLPHSRACWLRMV